MNDIVSILGVDIVLRQESAFDFLHGITKGRSNDLPDVVYADSRAGVKIGVAAANGALQVLTVSGHMFVAHSAWLRCR